MNPKSLRVTTTVKADSLEGAIAELSGRFLRATKNTAKVVTQPTEFPVLPLCELLTDDWHNGKVAYAPGSITLVFSQGTVEPVADLLIYKPEDGDRLLYSRASTSAHSEPQLKLPLGNEALEAIERQVQTLSDALIELTEHQRAVESRLRNWGSSTAAPSLGDTAGGISAQQLQSLLDAQSANFAQMLSTQFAATTRHFGQRLDQLQAQLEQLQAQLDMPEEPPLPQTDAEWQQRIQEAWGTVGDYEQYSASHREANAEAPLFHAPDWVALCELDWARRLNPALTQLHGLIHGEDGAGGVGYAVADVLQQFGCHIDGRTGDRYYIYKHGGFSAYDALWQTATQPQQIWLSALQRLSQKSLRIQEVFQLFGWESEAIAAIDTVVERVLREKQSGRQAGHQSNYGSQTYAKRPGNPIPDYLALLNVGPFTPITPESLKRAYKQAMKTAHPDTGGSKEMAQRVNEAYEAVLRHYFPSAI